MCGPAGGIGDRKGRSDPRMGNVERGPDHSRTLRLFTGVGLGAWVDSRALRGKSLRHDAGILGWVFT